MKLYQFLILIAFPCVLLTFSANANTRTTECTFNGGFNLAHSKQIYKNDCSESQEQEFLTGYRIGRKLAWVESAIIYEDQPKELHELKEKQNKIIKLKNEIAKDSSKAETLIKQYTTTGQVDELDIDLNWKAYIDKNKGLQNLDESTKNLIYTEIPDNPKLPEHIRNGGLIGFGLGHKRQSRSNEALKYQIVDTILMASLIAGLTKQNHSVFNEVLGLIGIPLSRSFQLLDLYTHNQENNFNIDNLRTKNQRQPIHLFSYNFTW